MQHIPLPHNPTIGYIEVPCLTDQEYDGGDLETFPARQGYPDKTISEWKTLFDDPPADFVAFLQLWQYFGYIGSILPFSTSKILTKVREDGSRVVDTSNLITMVNDYVESIPEGYEKQEGDLIWRLKRSLRLMMGLTWGRKTPITTTTSCLGSTLISLYRYMTTFEFRDPLPPTVSDSIYLLREIFFNVDWNYPSPFTLQQWRHPTINGQVIEGIVACGIPGGGVYGQRMLENNWCPSRIQGHGTKMRLADLVYVANLSNQETLSHENCNIATCCYARVDESSYHTRHATGCDGCYPVAADTHKMSVILEEGSYPVVDLLGPITAEDKLCLSSVGSPGQAAGSSHPFIPYVAISHVWSDGLGNPHENSIPYCQLGNLRRLVRTIPHPPELGPYSCFWLDTICCPVEDGSDIQTMAIAKMKATYENASAVLVLDSSLLKYSAHNLTDVEILWRIICSKWTSRLWTLQEGALARRVFFQFADGPYDLQSGVSRLLTNTDPNVRLTMRRSIQYHIQQLRSPVESSNQAGALRTLANATSFRSTSVASDEPLCLANLLGFDSSTISQIPASDPRGRMIAFWKLVSHVPLVIAFENRAKLSQPGFQWAPVSLLGFQFPSIPDRKYYVSTSVERTDSGLWFHAPGIRMSPSGEMEIPANSFLRTIKGTWFSVKALPELPISDSGSGPLMIICLTELNKGALSQTSGLLVEELGGGDYGEYRARIVANVGVSIWEGHDDPLMDGAVDVTVINNEAAELPVETLWCLQ